MYKEIIIRIPVNHIFTGEVPCDPNEDSSLCPYNQRCQDKDGDGQINYEEFYIMMTSSGK